MQDKTRDILQEEKMSVLMYMQRRRDIAWLPKVCRKKNIVDSAKYRKRGNELYKNRSHDERVHEKIWKLYTQSIALAPNNSEELALGYGNRSALLFHLEMYRESMKDCDRAVNITSLDSLKAKLLYRKAECLALLNESSAEDVIEKALQLINNSSLNHAVKIEFETKLNNISIGVQRAKSKKNSKTKNHYNDLANFPRQEEAPCASQSVAIKYNKKWGRHIVATKDIKPGEIIAIEENYYTFIYPDGMYLFCSNCTQYTWSSIPCEHCIYDVYCSESCRAEAWVKYHQFECPIYPYLWDIDEDTSVGNFAIRLLHIAIHEACSIDQMRKVIADIEHCKDPRVKGFSNGVLRSDKAKSIYGLLAKTDTVEPLVKYALIECTCTYVYYLATHTNFFGKKLKISPSNMFLNEDILFIAALLLRTHYMTPFNCTKLQYAYGSEIVTYAAYIKSFTSLLNHSCDPNVDCHVGSNNKTIVYARCPIKKGSQVFTSYTTSSFFIESREDRQDCLQNVYDFTCHCLACTENWSNVCLPSLKEMMKTTPALSITILRAFEKMHGITRLITKRRIGSNITYDPKLMRDVVLFLEMLAEKVTVHCDAYIRSIECLTYLLQDLFGCWLFEVLSKCSL